MTIASMDAPSKNHEMDYFDDSFIENDLYDDNIGLNQASLEILRSSRVLPINEENEKIIMDFMAQGFSYFHSSARVKQYLVEYANRIPDKTFMKFFERYRDVFNFDDLLFSIQLKPSCVLEIFESFLKAVGHIHVPPDFLGIDTTVFPLIHLEDPQNKSNSKTLNIREFIVSSNYQDLEIFIISLEKLNLDKKSILFLFLEVIEAISSKEEVQTTGLIDKKKSCSAPDASIPEIPSSRSRASSYSHKKEGEKANKSWYSKMFTKSFSSTPSSPEVVHSNSTGSFDKIDSSNDLKPATRSSSLFMPNYSSRNLTNYFRTSPNTQRADIDLRAVEKAESGLYTFRPHNIPSGNIPKKKSNSCLSKGSSSNKHYSDDFTEQLYGPIFDVILNWTKLFPEDFKPHAQFFTAYIIARHRLFNPIFSIALLKQMSNILTEKEDINKGFPTYFPAEIENVSFKLLNSEMLAIEFLRFDYSLVNAIPLREFMLDTESRPNLSKYIGWSEFIWNTFARILLNSPKNLKKIRKKLLKLSTAALKYGHLNLASNIFFALNNSSISRLFTACQDDSEKHWEELQQLFSVNNNFANYREYCSRKNPVVIPYFATINKYLEFSFAANPLYLPIDQNAKNSQKAANFYRFQVAHSTILTIIELRKKKSLMDVYPFHYKQGQSWIMSLFNKHLSVLAYAESLEELSEKIKPRINPI